MQADWPIGSSHSLECMFQTRLALHVHVAAEVPQSVCVHALKDADRLVWGVQDPEAFEADGGWSFLDMEGESDEEEEESEEGDPEFQGDSDEEGASSEEYRSDPCSCCFSQVVSL